MFFNNILWNQKTVQFKEKMNVQALSEVNLSDSVPFCILNFHWQNYGYEAWICQKCCHRNLRYAQGHIVAAVGA